MKHFLKNESMLFECSWLLRLTAYKIFLRVVLNNERKKYYFLHDLSLNMFV